MEIVKENTVILTLTLNPSIDATLVLKGQMIPGSVHRLEQTMRCAGGKGINVSHAAALAGVETQAVFPVGPHDLFATLIEDIQLPHRSISISHNVRTNTTITQPDGETTKFNGPGPVLSAEDRENIIAALTEEAQKAQWLVMAGSLPPGCPHDFYSTLIQRIRKSCPDIKIAVDTSDAAMIALGDNLNSAAPDLLKPNSFELGQLTGLDGAQLEAAAERGDYSGILEAAEELLARGIPELLITLGGAGALLVNHDGAWHAATPPTTVVSTVGAGDCSLAGYVMARMCSEAPSECLRRAVAYGSAATSLPGTEIPTPEQLQLNEVSIHPLTRAGKVSS